MIRTICNVCLLSTLICGVRSDNLNRGSVDGLLSEALQLFLAKGRNGLDEIASSIKKTTNIDNDVKKMIMQPFGDWRAEKENNIHTERTLLTKSAVSNFYDDLEIPVGISPVSVGAESEVGDGSTMSVVSSVSNFVVSDINSYGFSVKMDATFDVTNSRMQLHGSFDVADIHLAVRLSEPLDEGLFWHLRQQRLFSYTRAFPCLVSYSVLEAPIVTVNVTTFSDPVVRDLPPVMNWVSFLLPEENRADFVNELNALLPHVLDVSRVPIIKEFISMYAAANNCEQLTAAYDFLDFRDFFLPPSRSVALGGSGNEPYGNMGQLMYRMLDTFNQDPSVINAMLPATIEFDAVSFDYNFSHDIVKNFWEIDNIYLKVFDAEVNNFDIVQSPFRMAMPTDHAHILNNSFHLGPDPYRRTSGKIALQFDIEAGEESLFSDTKNEFDVGFEMSSLDVASELLVTISAAELLQFPFENILEMPCWIALIPVNDDVDEGFRILSFLSRLNGFSLFLKCRECHNRVFQTSIPTMLDILNATSATSLMGYRLSLFGEEFMLSDTFAALADNAINFSKKMCPHREEYDEGAIFLLMEDEDFNPFVQNRTSPLHLPPFSDDSIETAIFTASIFGQAGIVVFSDFLSEITVANRALARKMQDDQDTALSPEGQVPVPSAGEDSNNFLSVINEGQDMVSQGVDLVNNFLLNMGVDESTCTPVGTKWGRRVSTYVVDESDAYVLDPALTFDLGSRKVTLSELKVMGIRSISTADILSFEGFNNYRSEIGLEKLALEVEVKISALIDDGGQRVKGSEDMVFKATLAVESLEIALDFLLLMNNERVSDMKLGSFLTIEHIFPCLLSLIQKMELSDLMVSIGAVRSMKISGFSTPDVAKTAEDFQNEFLEEFHQLMVDSIPILFGAAVREFVNEVIDLTLKSYSDCPAVDYKPNLDGYIDFRDLLLNADLALLHGGSGMAPYGNLISTAMDLVYEQMKVDDKGFALVNNLFRKHCPAGQEHVPYYNYSLVMNGALLNESISVHELGINADAKVLISDFSVENIDSMGAPIALLNVTNESPHKLNNVATVGVNKRPLTLKLQMYFFLFLGLVGEPSENDFELSVALHSASGVFDGLLKIYERKLMEFPIMDVTNLDCLLAMLPEVPLSRNGTRLFDPDPGMDITHVDLSLEQVDLRLNCRNCSSHLKEISEKLYLPAATVNITWLANQILNVTSRVLKDGLILDQIAPIINNAAKKCPHSPEYDSDWQGYEPKPRLRYSSSFMPLLLFGFIIVLTIAACGFYIVINRLIARRRQHKWLSNLTNDQYKYKKSTEIFEKEMMDEIDAAGNSLFTSPYIPIHVRVLIPIIILGNIGFFLSGHLSLGAIGRARVAFLGNEFFLDGFNEVSIGKSTVDLWKLGSRSAAAFVFAFSVLWPYIKQLISLFLWFVPPKMFPSLRRGWCYEWLDTLAKWSMVDVMLMVINLCGMRVSIHSPKHALLPDNFYSAELLALPIWGLYANMIAQLISQISSHFIIYYDRLCVEKDLEKYKERHSINRAASAITEENSFSDGSTEATKEVAKYGSRKDRLCDFEFIIPQSNGERVVQKGCVNVLIGCGAALFFVLAIASCVLTSISFETLGLIGLVHELSLNGANSIDNFSVLGFATLLSDQARFINSAAAYIGLNSINAVFIFTVLVVPILQMITLLWLWFVPLTGDKRKKGLILLEGLIAWEYSEVYLLTLVVQTWQFEEISELLFNDFCGMLDPFFRILVEYDVLLPEDGQCYARRTTIELGGYLMFICVFLLYLMNSYILSAAIQYFRQRDGCDYVPPEDQLPPPPPVILSEEESDERVIRPFPALFTDLYGFALRKSKTKMLEESVKVDGRSVEMVETFRGTDTKSGSSEEEDSV